MTTMLNKRRTIILSVIGLILLLPIIGMQFTNEVNWTASDFLIAGILLGSIGIAVDFALATAKSNTQRAVLLAIILIIGFLIWAELAVGLFGTPFAGN